MVSKRISGGPTGKTFARWYDWEEELLLEELCKTPSTHMSTQQLDSLYHRFNQRHTIAAISCRGSLIRLGKPHKSYKDPTRDYKMLEGKIISKDIQQTILELDVMKTPLESHFVHIFKQILTNINILQNNFSALMTKLEQEKQKNREAKEKADKYDEIMATINKSKGA